MALLEGMEMLDEMVRLYDEYLVLYQLEQY